MKTFSVTILGCRVNHYESEQIARALRRRGLTQVNAPAGDVRVIHTCSVTQHAAKDSRQAVRRATRLPVLGQSEETASWQLESNPRAKVIVTGCWATSDRAVAEKMPGVDAVITHHEEMDERLEGLLKEWIPISSHREGEGSEGRNSESPAIYELTSRLYPLPQGEERKTHQRAFLKIQDGCDAHCTYCIIPQLRPALWSKPIDDAVAEARQLVDAGHKEIVLTGIFLGAYGQPTALRRRQDQSAGKPVAALIDALCTRVRGLIRLRLSSIEPGDLEEQLLQSLRRHEQIVPHFHLPLQSGSDAILRRMNRQYSRGQFIELIGKIQDAFDRPALTTDIIAGFPGETEEDFARTLEVVDRARFIHIHAFGYSPRPRTAAARWTDGLVHGTIANQRVNLLNDRAQQHGHAFRQQFIGQTVTILVERDKPGSTDPALRHGRCERYFDVHFSSDQARTGDLAKVLIESTTPTRTHGKWVS